MLLVFGAMMSAHGQRGGGHGGRQKDQEPAPQQSPTAKAPVAVPEPWPRLDPGAVLCKSRDDLVRYQTQRAEGASAATAKQTSDCHTVGKQTGIQIVDRDGPSRTQIVTTDDSKQTGWTNAYLPDTAPSATRGTGSGK